MQLHLKVRNFIVQCKMFIPVDNCSIAFLCLRYIIPSQRYAFSLQIEKKNAKVDPFADWLCKLQCEVPQSHQTGLANCSWNLQPLVCLKRLHTTWMQSFFFPIFLLTASLLVHLFSSDRCSMLRPLWLWSGSPVGWGSSSPQSVLVFWWQKHHWICLQACT